jgi:hypothetical protein
MGAGTAAVLSPAILISFLGSTATSSTMGLGLIGTLASVTGDKAVTRLSVAPTTRFVMVESRPATPGG